MLRSLLYGLLRKPSRALATYLFLGSSSIFLGFEPLFSGKAKFKNLPD